VYCTASCQPQNCGDGNLDPGEDCDDGNLVDCDGCSAKCEDEELPTLTMVDMVLTSNVNRLLVGDSTVPDVLPNLRAPENPSYEDNGRVQIGGPGPLWRRWAPPNRPPGTPETDYHFTLPISVKMSETPDLGIGILVDPVPTTCAVDVEVDASYPWGQCCDHIDWAGANQIPKGFVAPNANVPPLHFVPTPRTAGTMPNYVIADQLQITWNIRAKLVNEASWTTLPAVTTSNELFVTVDRPGNAAIPTVKRTRWATSHAAWLSTQRPITIQLHDDLSGLFTGAGLFSKPFAVLDPKGPGQGPNGGDCMSLSALLRGMLSIVGLPYGTVVQLFATTDGDVMTAETRTCPTAAHRYLQQSGPPPVYANGDYLFLDIGGVPNYFEATLGEIDGLDGEYYPGGVPGVWTNPLMDLCRMRQDYNWNWVWMGAPLPAGEEYEHHGDPIDPPICD